MLVQFVKGNETLLGLTKLVPHRFFAKSLRAILTLLLPLTSEVESSQAREHNSVSTASPSETPSLSGRTAGGGRQHGSSLHEDGDT